jgi:serine/threonine protein kinase
MGTVYSAVDRLSVDAPRALKELVTTGFTPEEQAEAELWFLREGDTLRSLTHEAVPRIHDAFSLGPRHYLVMDLVEGATLEAVLDAQDGRPVHEEEIVAWADQILDVLNYLHSLPQPVVFRDLKPANIMLTPQSNIRLIDFGIARVVTRQSIGTAIGTPGYAPPEQYQGLAEPASDLYALGATMHHLITGRDPRTSRLFDFPPVRSLAPGVSQPVAGAIDRALVLDPRHRFDTAADMFRALHATTPLANLARLTVAAPSALRAGPVTVPLADEIEATVFIGPLLTRGGPDVITLASPEGRITAGGLTVVLRSDKRTIELHNHRDDRLACRIMSSLPDVQPDAETTWIQAHGMASISLGPTAYVTASAVDGRQPSTGGPNATATEPSPGRDVQVALHVEGLSRPAPFRPRVMPNALPMVIVAASNGGFVLLTTGHVLPIQAFFIYEVPALILAMWVQRRGRTKS